MTMYTGQAREFFLADHLVLLAPLFSLSFILAPSPYTLSVMHNLAFSAVYFMTPILVREVFKTAKCEKYVLPATIFLLFAIWLYPGMAGAWRFQSHMTTLAMPLVMLALVCLHKNRIVPLLLCCLLLALAQERSSVAVFGIGMYAALIFRNYKLGLALCIFSALYFFIAVKLVIPWCAGGNYMYMSNIHPFTEINKKLFFLLLCFAGFFFLGLCGRSAFFASLCAMPLLMIGLVSNRTAMYGFSHQYQDLPSIFLFAGAIFGLARFISIYQQKRWLVYIGSVFVIIIIICMENPFFQKNSIYRLAIRQENQAVTFVNEALRDYNSIPANIHVYASSGIHPRLAVRQHSQLIDPKNSGQQFMASMVFVAPTLNMFPNTPKQTEQILENLKNNDSLRPVLQHEHLYVYASKDVQW